jgi:hypothetical protein
VLSKYAPRLVLSVTRFAFAGGIESQGWGGGQAPIFRGRNSARWAKSLPGDEATKLMLDCIGTLLAPAFMPHAALEPLLAEVLALKSAAEPEAVIAERNWAEQKFCSLLESAGRQWGRKHRFGQCPGREAVRLPP